MTSPLRRIVRPGFACAIALASGLAGCSSDGGDDWLSLWKVARDSWDNRASTVSIEQAAAIPYASVGIRLDGGPQQILVLATDRDGERLWTSSSEIAIMTRDGRIARTSGLAGNLSGHFRPDTGEEDWMRPHSYDWSADFADLGYYSVSIHCDVRPEGEDPIDILGSRIATVRVTEQCHSDLLKWDYSNTYWVSPASQRVWRSISHIHPKGAVIELEILRPPLGDR